MEHQRGRDIVRQVAEDAQRLAHFLRQFAKVHGHRILLIDGQLWTEERMRLQASRQIAVQFDDGQLVKAFADRLGQGRQAGADFNHRLAFLRVNRRDDAVDHKLIVEEVLPEAFTG
ncbi:Uncharacterised protein [Klebsiella pneumoniae]|nr:Uncharacterised protein [Klebsiella pneumoniae]